MSRLPSPGRRPQPEVNTPLPALSLFPAELSRNLRVESVSRLDPSPPRSLDAAAAVAAAVEAMRQDRVGCLLVTRLGRVVGIFTERDLLTRVLAPGRPLATPLAA